MSCYIKISKLLYKDIPQVFSLFIYLFLELKHKCCNLLSHNYFLFTSDRKSLKIIAFPKQDCLNMNGSSTGLGKKMTQLQYAVIALKISVE